MLRYAVILAAGQGKRMQSSLPKVLHNLCGQPLLEYVMAAAQPLLSDKPVIITGFGADMVEKQLAGRAVFCRQPRQLGTGHAVACAEEVLQGAEGLVLVAAGDMPFLTEATLQALFLKTEAEDLSACVLTAQVENPAGYGRIVRENGRLSIVEQKDATPAQKAIAEVNTSVYCFSLRHLFAALKKVTPNNAQQEYYLTDVLSILQGQGLPVGAMPCQPGEGEGINDRVQLAQAEGRMRGIINRRHMLAGVTLIDPQTTYIGPAVVIGRDTIIHPQNTLQGTTVIGENCLLLPGNRLENVTVGDTTQLAASTLENALVGSCCTVGPNAYLRPGAQIGDHCRIGDFVEIKNAVIGEGTKVSHLAYVGDAKVGKHCNIGCGVVFVNYNGKHKNISIVEDNVFVGSNSNLVAPVHLYSGAYVAAGSTINHDVESDALAIARARQENKPGYAARLKRQWENE